MKRKIATILLSVMLAVSVCGCNNTSDGTNGGIPTKQPSDSITEEPTKIPVKEEIEPIRLISGEGYVEERDEDTYATIISATYPYISLYYESMQEYPNLYDVLLKVNESNRNAQKNQLELYKEFAYEQYKELPEDVFSVHEVIQRVSVRRADSKVVSLLYDGHIFLGGMTGKYYYKGENYDSKTGKKLSLSDVVTDEKLLPDMIIEQLDKFWNSIPLNADLDWEQILHDEENLSWTLDNHGVTLYFGSYLIAPYVSGTQIVTLSNEEYPELLKEEYKKGLSSYGIEIPKDTPFYYDVTGDGKVDEILCSWYEGDYGDAGEFSIYVNGKYFSQDYFAYDANVTFVHMENGDNLLSVECLWDNDYRDTTIYKLGNQVTKIGEVDASMHYIFHENPEMYRTRDVLVNPKKFYMDVKTDVLSTVTGYAEYGFGNDGIPKIKQNKYIFAEEYIYTLTLLKDIDVDIYDEKLDKIIGQTTILTGEEVRYYSTDNSQYVYLLLNDGTIVRKEILLDDWKWLIDGSLREDIFEGMFFSG